jgi:hypothetical protein
MTKPTEAERGDDYKFLALQPRASRMFYEGGFICDWQKAKSIGEFR